MVQETDTLEPDKAKTEEYQFFIDQYAADAAFLLWSGSAALPVVLTPLFSCVLTLLYYDLRVRREAFDLEVLSEQLGAGGAVR